MNSPGILPLVAAILVIAAPSLGGVPADIEGHESMDLSVTVSVAPRTVCLYGHWISGETTLELRDSCVYLGGIRVLPKVHEPVEVSRDEVEEDLLGPLVRQWAAKATALRADGWSKEHVIAAGRTFFGTSEPVIRLEMHSDGACTIYGRDNDAYLVRLWTSDQPPVTMKREDREDRGTGPFLRILDTIHDHRGVIVLADVQIWYPRAVVESPEFRRAVEAIDAAHEPIEEAQWDSSYPITWFEAEAIRNPLPDDLIRKPPGD